MTKSAIEDYILLGDRIIVKKATEPTEYHAYGPTDDRMMSGKILLVGSDVDPDDNINIGDEVIVCIFTSTPEIEIEGVEYFIPYTSQIELIKKRGE